MTRCNGVAAVAAIIGQIKDAGLDHIQLSFQNSTKKMNGFLTGTKTFDCKSRVAKLIKQHDYPTVLNVVLHRYNLDHVERIIDMALKMGGKNGGNIWNWQMPNIMDGGW
jgi:pyrroloquinoline quinone biosynthesis protein E